jgi:hypothetical protein
VKNAGFACYQTRDMHVTCDPQNFVESWLTGAVIADGHFANANDRIKMHYIVPHTAYQGHRRQVVTASMAPGAHTFLAKCASLCQQGPGIACRIIRTQNPNNTGYAGSRESTQRYRWHSTGKTGLSTAAGHVGVAINEAWHDAAPVQIIARDSCQAKVRFGLADPEDSTSADQNVANTDIFRSEDVSIL